MIDFETMLSFSPIAGEVRRTRERAGESIKGNPFETQAARNYSPSPKREGGTSYCMGLAIFWIERLQETAPELTEGDSSCRTRRRRLLEEMGPCWVVTTQTHTHAHR